MIYIVEDDESIRKLVEYSLVSRSYTVKSFPSSPNFCQELENNIPDLILLDIMLPVETGLEILKKLKDNKMYSNIPVIMLTAKDTEFDVVTGLDAGADDYITKPFGMMNLLARIKAVLRRYENKDKQSNDNLIEYKSIKIDINKHTVFVDDKQIFLTIKEFDLLVLLIQNKEIVLTREKLLDLIWNIDTFIDSRTVDVHIKTLRQKLDTAGDIIETVRGVGYKCV